MAIDGGTRATYSVTRSAMAAPLTAAGGFLAAWPAILVIDPSRTVLLPCPLFAMTGMACPLCGGTRAAHALAHGDLVAAAGYNMLFVPVAVAAVVLWTRWLIRRARGEPAAFVVLSTRSQAVIAGVLLLFALARNWPGAEGLMP
jgi:hypothetical protein